MTGSAQESAASSRASRCGAALSRMPDAWRALRWYTREFFGDSAYERYLQRHQAAHPGSPIMSEREFWRRRDQDAEERTGTGCC